MNIKPEYCKLLFFYLLFFSALSFSNGQGSGNTTHFNSSGTKDDYFSTSSASGDELNPSSTITLESWVNLAVATSGTHTPELIVDLALKTLMNKVKDFTNQISMLTPGSAPAHK